MEEKSATNQPVPAPRPPVSEIASAPPSRRRFRAGFVVVVVLALILMAAAVIYYVKYIAPYEETDDAFIESYVTFISPRVSGPVVKLRVTDNQRVKVGDVLLEIDPRDYQMLVDQAKADQQQAAVAAAQTIADRTEADRARYESVQSQAISRSQFDLAKTQASSAVAEVEVARNQARDAVALVELDRADIETARAQVQQVQTRLEQAQIGNSASMSNTRLTISRKNAKFSAVILMQQQLSLNPRVSVNFFSVSCRTFAAAATPVISHRE